MKRTFSPDVIKLNPHLFRPLSKALRIQVSAPWRSEREFMAAVIAECDLRAIVTPEYGLICHIPNENSHRQPGVRAGMPDLLLPVARGNFHGWYCELKIQGGKCSAVQRTMHHRLRMEGYRVVTIWDSVDEVMSEIEEYLNP